ncbi:MAG TPA: hypothetical protein VMK31_03595 [Sphingomicrobium sp.]|nr:hypothetical protein [Sphingomicrobium sp.]
MSRLTGPCAILLAFLAAPAFAQDAAAPPACAGPEHRQFDFWVGSWDVYPTGKPDLVARSLIEKLYAGCTIRENWMPLKGGGGGSLNMYDPADGRWHQTWHDSSNARVKFEGGLAGDKMVLTGFWKNAGGADKDGLVRMTYSKAEAGAVQQFGEISTDHGVSWSPFFDFTYKPRADSN